jgi:hypothetical protein
VGDEINWRLGPDALDRFLIHVEATDAQRAANYRRAAVI